MPSGDSPHHRPPRRPGGQPRRRPAAVRPARAAPADRPAAPAPARRPPRPRPILLVRYLLPALVVLAGVVAMAFGTETSLEGGAGLVSAGLAIWFINWLFRIGAAGDAERDAEDRAREYFDRHGHWPEGR